jgi:hypothetical protein
VSDLEVCAACGWLLEWVDCWVLDCEGGAYHDCGEDTCCCAEPAPDTACDVCEGRGGWLCCQNRECKGAA